MLGLYRRNFFSFFKFGLISLNGGKTQSAGKAAQSFPLEQLETCITLTSCCYPKWSELEKQKGSTDDVKHIIFDVEQLRCKIIYIYT